MNSKIIIEKVCKALQLKINEVKSANRKSENIEARQIIYKMLKDEGINSRRAGELFSKDHAAVEHAIKKYNEKVQIRDKQFLAKIALVSAEMERDEN
jgi:chromosomal replication initiation ATPase DnaA